MKLAKTTIELDRQELFKAIFEYVRKNYPVEGELNASISHDRHNYITGVKVSCKLKMVENGSQVNLTPKKN